MFEQHMKDMKKEKVSQRQRNTPNTSVAVEVAVKGEATVEDQKKKEKYRREAARKRAGTMAKTQGVKGIIEVKCQRVQEKVIKSW